MARILVLTFFLVLLTIIKANSIDNLSFTFKKFKPNQPNLIFQGDAVATSSGKLQLTNEDRWSLGRVLYTTPIQIWDKETGNAASFTSSFSITINVSRSMNPADGFAFFLAPIDSQPQTKGGSLGIYNGDRYNTLLQTVAVEFDTYENSWDPKGQHIGINVNNARSIKTLPWSLVSDGVAKIRVTYDASTSLLAASLIYPSEKTSYILSEKVDLKSVLPEWVRIGFSATSGGRSTYIETHEVLSWSFSSGEGDGSDLASFMLHEPI